jgi:hypothetical protein
MGILGAVEEVERMCACGWETERGGFWKMPGGVVDIINIAGNACVSLPRVSLVSRRYSIVTATGFHPSWKLAPHRTARV